MKGSKGLELPINVIVIVAIAVLVLVVAAALFSSQFGAGVGTITLESAYGKACNTLRTVYNCRASDYDNVKVSGYQVPGRTSVGKDASLGQICQEKFKDAGERQQELCYTTCGCNWVPRS